MSADILIVEDESEYRDMWAEDLQLSGAVVSCAANEEECINVYDALVASGRTPALIIMDGDYGEGGDFCRPLRHIRQTYTGRVLAASGNESTRDLQRAFGCTDEAPLKAAVPSIARRILRLPDPVPCLASVA